MSSSQKIAARIAQLLSETKDSIVSLVIVKIDSGIYLQVNGGKVERIGKTLHESAECGTI